MTTTTLKGISGAAYVFDVFEATDVTWNPVPGLYVFADHFGNPKYVGETGSFVLRNPGPKHETWAKAASHGASIILAMVYHGSESDRKPSRPSGSPRRHLKALWTCSQSKDSARFRGSARASFLICSWTLAAPFLDRRSAFTPESVSVLGFASAGLLILVRHPGIV
jgi:hypothetical protein